MGVAFCILVAIIIVVLIIIYQTRRQPQVVFTQISLSGNLIKGSIKEMELRENQQVVVTANLQTASGHPAAFETGTAQWSSSDETIASVEVNPDNELEATIKGLDGSTNGSAVIEFRCDGDPDADQTREIIGTLDIVVTQGEATVVSLEAGTPTDS